MNHYISQHEYVKDRYFDTVQYKINPSHYELLTTKGGLDPRLAFHVASLFVRDPIPTYDNELSENIDYEETTAHFENLQSTNWNSMRFKPPPSLSSPIGWRVEFRTLDIQLTDFENAAFIVLIGMLVNVANHFDVDFIMPISKIDENMDRAHKRDGILTDKFWFRQDLIKTPSHCYRANTLQQTDYLRSSQEDCSQESEPMVTEMYLYEILEGKPEIGFKGIYPLIEEYMGDMHYSKD